MIGVDIDKNRSKRLFQWGFRPLMFGFLVLACTSCTQEWTCVCGADGPEPYIYTICAANLNDAQIECAPLGSDCSLLER